MGNRVAKAGTVGKISMKKTILLSCSRVPSYGGAATFQYLLFEFLQELGYQAHYIALISRTEVKIYKSRFGSNWWNLANRENVHLYISNNLNRREQLELRNITRKINPNLIIGKNDLAPRLLKNMGLPAFVWVISGRF